MKYPHMPAEWAPHHGTLLSWPRNAETWPGDKLAKVEQVYVALCEALREPVYICAGGIMDHVESLVGHLAQVTLLPIPTNDNWMRDHGPIFVLDAAGKAAVTDWGYNAWGGKYPPYDLDNAVPYQIAEYFGLPVIDGGIILEGGSIEVDGAGTLLTTRSCLLNPNRNPHLNQEQIEARLKEQLGISRILWLEDGIAGDDTDGHIDDLTRLVGTDTILTIVEQNPADENYDILQQTLQTLQFFQTAAGTPYTIHTLPMPPALVVDGERLPASYANYYVANEVVLLPVFGVAEDAQAIATLAQLFQNREIVPIRCEALLWGLGGIHCITQQIPKATNLP